MKDESFFDGKINPDDLAICGISTEENRNNIVELFVTSD